MVTVLIVLLLQSNQGLQYYVQTEPVAYLIREDHKRSYELQALSYEQVENHLTDQLF